MLTYISLLIGLFSHIYYKNSPLRARLQSLHIGHFLGCRHVQPLWKLPPSFVCVSDEAAGTRTPTHRYCQRTEARVSTYWNDTVSLVQHTTVILPVCRLLGSVGEVLIENSMEAREAGKVKLVSVAICPDDAMA